MLQARESRLNKRPPSADAPDSSDPAIYFFDRRNHRAREMLIFMEETKVWGRLLDACHEKHQINSVRECRHLREIILERSKYYNAEYDPFVRPKMSPGIPPEYEKDYKKLFKDFFNKKE